MSSVREPTPECDARDLGPRVAQESILHPVRRIHRETNREEERGIGTVETDDRICGVELCEPGADPILLRPHRGLLMVRPFFGS